MVGLFVILLVVFLAAFFGLDIFIQLMGGSQVQIMDVTIGSLNDDSFKLFLGSVIIFLEIAIILFAMLHRVADTIREIVKPVARLVPLGAFLTATYKTFEPIVTPFFFADDPGTATVSAVNSRSFSLGILLTLGTMLLFLIANRILGGESAEIRALRAELTKYRRILK